MIAIAGLIITALSCVSAGSDDAVDGPGLTYRVVRHHPLSVSEDQELVVFGAGDTISDAIVRGQEWDAHVADTVAEHMTDNTTFLDIGANIGTTTLAVARR